MRRILQSLKTGITEVVETPCPQNKAGHVLIQTHCSLISPGTEKMLLDFGKGSVIDKIRQQPDKVRMVFEKIKTDGLLPTIEAVRDKLDQMIPLGYCNVGTILEIGQGVSDFAVGDRVVSNGAHSEIVCVPKNLCCKIPDDVSNESAAFTVLGAIALQGIRLANPTLGESFVVIGLGLIGLLTVQLLRAQGCRVLGMDFDTKKVELAAHFGAETVNLSIGQDPLTIATKFSRCRGVDGVLITASTQSNEPVHQAAQMCRKRGRIILVGVTGLELSRADFYEKELSFQVSCSYGPGRYDAQYEEKGQDYPLGFVRWTEQRNFEAVLDMLSSQQVSVGSLVSQRFALTEAPRAYQFLSENRHTLGILLEYEHSDKTVKLANNTIKISNTISHKPEQPCIGFIGAGNYASRVLIPAFKKTKSYLKWLACSGGVSGTHTGKKFGFENITTDIRAIFSDPQVKLVVIATRHDQHADLVVEALNANKHVFVEKPLCLTFQDLDRLTSLISQKPDLCVMVGFNRRFAPQIQKIKNLLSPIREPKTFVMTVNAGDIPASHWTQDEKVGGGRVIGEVCHFIDLLRFLVGAPVVQYYAICMDDGSKKNDKITISFSFADGSMGVIHYLANGHKSFPKERLEIFVAGKILQLDNFKKLDGYGWTTFKRMNLWRQDKGQTECVKQVIQTIITGTASPIPVSEIIEVSRLTLEVAKTVKESERTKKLYADNGSDFIQAQTNHNPKIVEPSNQNE